ncbi:MAG: hypothetical protein ACKORL_07680, partial [Phycisphaerales bacterium]
MTSRSVQRLLILGWDAADWQVIDPLLSRGRMQRTHPRHFLGERRGAVVAARSLGHGRQERAQR